MLPVVLLPGLLTDARLWAHQRAALSRLTAVIVPDLTKAVSIEALARQVLEISPPRFALAGLSLGGYVAMEMVRQAPERVDRLALLNTTAHPDLPEQTQLRKEFIALAREGGLSQVVPALMPGLVCPEHLTEIAKLAWEMANAVGLEGFIHQQTAAMNRPDARAGLSRITCPTLILCGRDDAMIPLEWSEEMASLIKPSRLVIIDQCGHLASLEQPQAVTAMLTYWLIL